MILEKVLENQKKCGIMFYVNLWICRHTGKGFIKMNTKEKFDDIMQRVYTNVRAKKDVVLSAEERKALMQYGKELGASYEDAKEHAAAAGVNLEAYVSFYKGLLDLYLVSGGVNPSVDNIGLELDEAFNNN